MELVLIEQGKLNHFSVWLSQPRMPGAELQCSVKNKAKWTLGVLAHILFQQSGC